MDKKIRICGLILAAFLCFSGCGENASEKETVQAPPAAETPQVQSALQEAVPSQEPVSSPEPEGPVPEEISEEWFDDALFIGDSITGMLSSHTLINGGLGDAKIVFANSYSCHDAVNKGVLLPYQGKQLSIGELVEAVGAKKVFFLLAMNDLGEPMENIISYWEVIVGDINERCPETDVFIQSGTPMFTETGYFRNKTIDELNEALKNFCLENGCVYVDIAEGLKDEDGHMKGKYSLDYAHFNGEGCKVWIEALMDRNNYTF